MKAALIYDGECPLCQRASEWVRRNAATAGLDILACQSRERAERFPDVAEARCLEAMLLVLEDGTVYAAEEALPPLFLRLRRWRWLAMVFGLPGVSWLAPWAYGFVARHRHVISILVARKKRLD